MFQRENVSRGGKRIFPECANRKRFDLKKREADRRAPPVRFKRREREGKARRRPKLAGVTGDEPEGDRERKEYRRAQGTLPRRERVETSKGKYHGDGLVLSGGGGVG